MILISQKIAIAMVSWTVLVLAVAGGGSVRLFTILILIGLLMVRVVGSVYMTPDLGERMDLMIQVGVIIFIAIVAERILSILGII